MVIVSDFDGRASDEGDGCGDGTVLLVGACNGADEGSWAAHTQTQNMIARHAGTKRGNPSPLSVEYVVEFFSDYFDGSSSHVCCS